mmetsp:Transcript_12768/g.42136  ORF Transcript_12768/g.42136 Transcript_12768/m.42136 type:complete len:213 (+) Transcript_12768:814-1452(+)
MLTSSVADGSAASLSVTLFGRSAWSAASWSAAPALTLAMSAAKAFTTMSRFASTSAAVGGHELKPTKVLRASCAPPSCASTILSCSAESSLTASGLGSAASTFFCASLAPPLAASASRATASAIASLSASLRSVAARASRKPSNLEKRAASFSELIALSSSALDGMLLRRATTLSPPGMELEAVPSAARALAISSLAACSSAVGLSVLIMFS